MRIGAANWVQRRRRHNDRRWQCREETQFRALERIARLDRHFAIAAQLERPAIEIGALEPQNEGDAEIDWRDKNRILAKDVEAGRQQYLDRQQRHESRP